MPGPLTASQVLPHGPLGRLGRELVLLGRVDSTNSYLLRRAGALPDGTVALAEYQTAGRGRLRRRWQAPRGSAVLASVLLHEPADSPLLALAGLAAALAAARAIERTTSCRPRLRWPNDLTADRRKLAGVLVEATTLAPHAPRRALVIGIGINCYQQAGHFGELVEQATSLELVCPEPIERAAVARELLACLDAQLDVGPDRQRWQAEILTAWRARCDDIGRRAELVEDGRTYSGTILDIAENGSLVVQLDRGGRRHFEPATTTRNP